MRTTSMLLYGSTLTNVSTDNGNRQERASIPCPPACTPTGECCDTSRSLYQLSYLTDFVPPCFCVQMLSLMDGNDLLRVMWCAAKQGVRDPVMTQLLADRATTQVSSSFLG